MYQFIKYHHKIFQCNYINFIAGFNCSKQFFIPYGENFTAIFTTLSVVIWFSTGTLGIFATLVYILLFLLVYVFTMRVYNILSMAIIPTLSTSIRCCNFCYILLWISPRSVVKIAIGI